jgi:hypothetical protein
VQDGRIYIEKVNWPFLSECKGSAAEYGAGLKLAIERGGLWLCEVHGGWREPVRVSLVLMLPSSCKEIERKLALLSPRHQQTIREMVRQMLPAAEQS